MTVTDLSIWAVYVKFYWHIEIPVEIRDDIGGSVHQVRGKIHASPQQSAAYTVYFQKTHCW